MSTDSEEAPRCRQSVHRGSFHSTLLEYTNVFRQQINLGETGPRTVVSGLINYVPIEEMRDKYFVAIVSVPPLLKISTPCARS